MPDRDRIGSPANAAPSFPGDRARGEIEIVREREVWSNELVRLFDDDVRYPDVDGKAKTGRQFRLARAADNADGVVVAPVLSDGRILLVRQFRHPLRRFIAELPRGSRERDEAPEDAAKRELSEETGYEAAEIAPLGRVAPDSGQLATMPHLFAVVVGARRAPHTEATEAIDRTLALTFRELREACEAGDIVDAYTIAAVLRLARRFDGDRFLGLR